MKMSEKKSCFIITPIGADDSLIRRQADGVIDAVIAPVLESLDFVVTVAHRMNDGGSITRQVIQNAINADLVVANLTNLNPNVMYELAIRHAVRKPLVQICEKDTDLPFDINEQRTIFYTNDMKGAVELTATFERMVMQAILDERPDNPIYRAIEAQSILQQSSPSEIDINNYLIERLDSIEKAIQQKDKRSSYKENSRFKIDVKVNNDILFREINSDIRTVLRDLGYGNSSSNMLSSRELKAGQNLTINYSISNDLPIESSEEIKQGILSLQSDNYTILDIRD
jgi:hypothetical protein